ncbi:MAG TPA: hypothetical protein EYP61_02695 [Candidatus Latescibacteria bacterium]|nr:hypothetical protein [Candidatus Latescibacterota bacterium]
MRRSAFLLAFLLVGSSAAQVGGRADIVEEVRRELEARKKGLSPFGYEVFETSKFQPDTLYGPVSPDYVVGPGDEVIVNVWGEVEFRYTATVGRDGFIDIPKVGPISVNGLNLGELRERIFDGLSRAYPGISRDPTRVTTFVEVSLGRLKPIRIFVIGEVKRPGAYFMSAASTPLNALYMAGGPLPTGSLRRIEVIRRGKVVATLDLYGYLLKGHIEEVKLQTDDTILVPPVGRRVWLAGRVHRPAIYELRPGEGLKELLDIAGGPEPDAYLGKVQVDRIVEHRERKVVDVDFAEALASGRKVELYDGDVVLIPQVLGRRENVVKVSSPVRRPGLYQWREGMRVRDLILEAEGVWEEAFMRRADIIRTRPDLTKEIISFDLEKALRGDGEENLELRKLDEVVVYSVHTFREEEYVTIDGSVKRPGRYELLENMTLKDLIVMAGGLRDTAYKLRAEVSRVDPDEVGPERPAEIIFVDIDDDYSKEANWGNFKLRNFDTVFIRPNPNWHEPRNVTVLGEVTFPGTYTLQRPDERLSEVIARAGGLKETAYPEGVMFVRRGSRIAVDLKKALEGGGDDIVLCDGDSITVPRRPQVVTVAGEVLFPSSVPYVEGKGVGYYLDRAGGLKETADGGRIRIILPNGRVEKPRRFWFDPEVLPGSKIFVPRKEGPKQGAALEGAVKFISAAAVAAFVVDKVIR